MTFTLGKINPNISSRGSGPMGCHSAAVQPYDRYGLPGLARSTLVEETAEDWYVAHRHDSPDGSYSLQIFVWPPGTRQRSTTIPPGVDSSARSGPC